jgi:hypothetical protein
MKTPWTRRILTALSVSTLLLSLGIRAEAAAKSATVSTPDVRVAAGRSVVCIVTNVSSDALNVTVDLLDFDVSLAQSVITVFPGGSGGTSTSMDESRYVRCRIEVEGAKTDIRAALLVLGTDGSTELLVAAQ